MGPGEVHQGRLSGGRHVCREVSSISLTSDPAPYATVTSDPSSRCLLFSPDGSCLFSGASDSLRVFGWEPDRCFDTVPVGWGKVSDLAVCNQQLVSGPAPA